VLACSPSQCRSAELGECRLGTNGRAFGNLSQPSLLALLRLARPSFAAVEPYSLPGPPTRRSAHFLQP
jgi:hypothetical protein